MMQVVSEDIVAERHVVPREEDEGVPHLIDLPRDHADVPVATRDEREVLPKLGDGVVDDVHVELAANHELLPHLREGVTHDPINGSVMIEFHLHSLVIRSCIDGSGLKQSELTILKQFYSVNATHLMLLG